MFFIVSNSSEYFFSQPRRHQSYQAIQLAFYGTCLHLQIALDLVQDNHEHLPADSMPEMYYILQLMASKGIAAGLHRLFRLVELEHIPVLQVWFNGGLAFRMVLYIMAYSPVR